MPEGIKLFTGNAHRELAKEIAHYLSIPLGDATVTKFSDGEIMVQINENVRGCDVFVVQPTCISVNQHIMELLLMVDALKRASAHRITAVIPGISLCMIVIFILCLKIDTVNSPDTVSLMGFSHISHRLCLKIKVRT